MTELTCHQVYQGALTLRSQNPLKSGMYKHKEANHVQKRVVATLERCGRALDPFVMDDAPKLYPLCVDYEFRSWARKVPMLIAEELGYKVVPAIEALTGDGFSPDAVKKLRTDIQPRLNDLIEERDVLRRSLPRGYVSNRAVNAMRDLAQRTQDLIETLLALKP